MRRATPDQVRAYRLTHSADYLVALELEKELSIRIRYGRLLKQLDLPEALETKFLQVLLNKENLRDDVNAAFAPSGGRVPSEMKPTPRQVYAAASAALDEEIAQLVGDEKAALVREYEAHRAENVFVTQFQQALATRGDVLTTSQEDKLFRLLTSAGGGPAGTGVAVVPLPHGSSVSITGGDIGFRTLGPGGAVVDSLGAISLNYRPPERSLDQAMAILSPEQFAVLGALCRKQEAEKMMGRAFGFNR